MKALLVSFGSAGDVNPFICLGLGLKDRGHSVSLITAGFFQDSVEQAGLECIPIGTREQFEEIITSPDLFDPGKGFGFVVRNMILKCMRGAYEEIERRKEDRPVIIAQSIAPAGRLAQEKLGLPLVTVNLQPVSIWSVHTPPAFPGLALPATWPLYLKRMILKASSRLVIDPQLAPGINEFRKELGLPKVKDIFPRWQYSPLRVIGLFPDWFAEPAPDWPPNTELTGFLSCQDDSPLTRDALRFLESGEPPVLFTAGSAMLNARAFFRAAAEACTKMHLRAILLTSYPDQLPPDLPPSIAHFDYLPFRSILPHCAAIVHHGGIGTVSAAIASGVPQLVMPFAHDQPDNARRVERLGLGLRISNKKCHRKELERKLELLLSSPGIKTSCQRFANRIDFGASLSAACHAIEQALSTT